MIVSWRQMEGRWKTKTAKLLSFPVPQESNPYDNPRTPQNGASKLGLEGYRSRA